MKRSFLVLSLMVLSFNGHLGAHEGSPAQELDRIEQVVGNVWSDPEVQQALSNYYEKVILKVISQCTDAEKAEIKYVISHVHAMISDQKFEPIVRKMGIDMTDEENEFIQGSTAQLMPAVLKLMPYFEKVSQQAQARYMVDRNFEVNEGNIIRTESMQEIDLENEKIQSVLSEVIKNFSNLLERLDKAL